MADILVIDDQDRTVELCRRSLPQHRYWGPARHHTQAEGLIAQARGRIDLVLLDVHFDIARQHLLGDTPDLDAAGVQALQRRQGLLVLDALRRRHPNLPVIVMTSREELPLEHQRGIEQAEEYTYFLDDDYVDARALAAQVERIVDARLGGDADGPVFWGRALPLRRVRQRLAVLARGGLPVVLLGPTGTGKSLIARHVLHPRSGRTGRFVSLDLSTLPADLMSAHLFGSVRGAWTGSVADRTGAFEAAHGGTLFLDEIGNLSMDAQKMLLSVLQEGVVTRLGDTRERSVDVKLVVATNEDLATRVREGSFRADLYMRLNPAAAVVLPPLADRHLDLGELVVHCLAQALRRPALRELVGEVRRAGGVAEGPVVVHTGPGVPEPTAGTLVLLWPERTVRLLRSHRWPGNLREFAMTVENAALFALTEVLAVPPGERADVVQVRPKVLKDLLAHAVEDPERGGGGQDVVVTLRPTDTLNKVAQECERQYFRHLWLEHRGDFAGMAAVLLDDPDAARKVQLRFNQLGLKVRELKDLLP
jgi:two-component system nitrogen regulation response regulator GlnG